MFVTGIAIDWKVLINMYQFPAKTHFHLALQRVFWSCVFFYITFMYSDTATGVVGAFGTGVAYLTALLSGVSGKYPGV